MTVRFLLRATVASVLSLLALPSRAQNEWIPLDSAASPSARLGAAVAFDSARHRLVLFGGNVTRRPGGPSDETWEWDGAIWTRKDPRHRPAARSNHTLAYDSARGRVVSFGGVGVNGAFADTWEWDGDDWSLVSADGGPDARSEHALAFDGVRLRCVLFGGRGRGDHLLDDTWEWNGATWTRAALDSSPPALAGHAMAFDSARGRVVLFGGNDGWTGSLDETWEWDGASWRGVVTIGTPSPREHVGLAFDDSRGVSVLFGGELRSGSGLLLQTDDDTWEWTGAAWRRATTLRVPDATRRPLLAFDPTCAKTLLVGYDDQSLTNLETWALSTGLRVTAMRPEHGSEEGGDILVIEGVGLRDADELSVTVGRADAHIVDVSCNRVRVRTPAGTGIADVVVRSSARTVTLPASFRYMPAEIAARLGGVGAAGGATEDVLLVNGGVGDLERRLMAFASEPLWIYVKAPSSRKTARFALWVWVGEPDATTLSRLPFGVGTLVFPIGSARATFNNLGRPRVLGAPTIQSGPAPSEVLRRSSGIPNPARLALQGLIEDNDSPNAFGVSVTNAVIVRALRSGQART